MPNRARLHDEHQATRTVTRAAIVAEATALADADGLEAVSIRRVAARVHARPMSLYTYFGAKGELLAAMADAVVGEIIGTTDQRGDWRADLAGIARRSHAAFTAHPWVLAIAGARPDLGRNALLHAEQLLAAIAPLQLEPADAWQVLYAVNDLTLGHALRVAHSTREPGLGYPQHDPALYPNLTAASTESRPRDEQSFEAALALLLDGIEARYAIAESRPTSSPA